MTKQILAFLFCFIKELNLYSPLTYFLTSARELKPFTPPFTYSLTSARELKPSPSPPRANSNLYSPLTSIPKPSPSAHPSAYPSAL